MDLEQLASTARGFLARGYQYIERLSGSKGKWICSLFAVWPLARKTRNIYKWSSLPIICRRKFGITFGPTEHSQR